MTDDRPAWGFKSMTEADFRRIHRIGMIVSVEARCEMTGVDTSREWLEVETRDGATIVLPRNWNEAMTFVGHSSNPGLFKLTYDGERMTAQADAIDKWEADNARERVEFERLKAKFEGTPA